MIFDAFLLLMMGACISFTTLFLIKIASEESKEDKLVRIKEENDRLPPT